MDSDIYPLKRRQFIAGGLALSLSPLLSISAAQAGDHLRKAIPVSGEMLPVIGLGTSRTFDVGGDSVQRSALQSVLQQFFDAGGSLIDSSPMYGNAEQVTGDLLAGMKTKPTLFAATKVWTDGREQGVTQMNRSFDRMGVKVMDLMQIHNLRDWQLHLKTLREWKEQGRIRYIGITTSHGRDHQELEEVLKKERFDFVQLSYNILDRAVEERLLPLAADRGIAVLANRAFQRGAVFSKVKGQQLPPWAAEFGCASWGQFFLKFVVSHPAVTCTIPATSKLRHMVDNMAAGLGELPDEKTRQKMIALMA